MFNNRFAGMNITKIVSLFLSLLLLFDSSSILLARAGTAVTLNENLSTSTPLHTGFNLENLQGLLSADMEIQKDSSIDISKPLVFLVRDLHCNKEAQLKISSAIKKICDKASVGLVLLEGATGLFNIELIRAFPGEKARRQIGRKFLEEGCITGAEYAVMNMDINKQVSLFGAEDAMLYMENLEIFRNVHSRLKENNTIIESVNGLFSGLEEKAFSGSMKKWFQAYKKFNEGSRSLKEVVKLVESTKDKRSYKHLSKDIDLLTEIFEKTELVDKSGLDREREALFREFEARLVKEELTGLVKLNLMYRLGQINTGIYLEELGKKANSIKRPFKKYYPQLELWKEIETTYSKLDIPKLSSDLESVIRRHLEELARENEVTDILNAFEEWLVVKDLIELKLRREQLEKIETLTYSSFAEDCRELAEKYGLENSAGHFRRNGNTANRS